MEMKSLGELVSISKGKKLISVLDAMQNGAKRFIQIDDLRNNNNLKYTFDKGVEVNEKDVIIAWDGANAGTIGFKLKGNIGSTLARLRIKNDKIDSDYLGWLLRGKYRFIRDKCTGATIPHVNKAVLESIKVPIHPLIVQRKIASILEQADAARQKRKEANRLTEQFLQSAFLEMFGDPVRNEKGWEVSILGNHINYLTSGSRGWAKYYSSHGDLFIRIENIGRSKMFLQKHKLQFINAPVGAEAMRTKLKEGDLLVSITADLGRSAVVPQLQWDTYINQHLALIRVNEQINPIFLSNYLSSEGGQMQFRTLNKGGVKAGLNFNDIRSLKFINPPHSLQKNSLHW
ncbi:MAG: restriction endonuclease subunit S [Bacteroidetes bacterium]|nr:restriction endonuclease subunit S [Bacteroidota bacterium]